MKTTTKRTYRVMANGFVYVARLALDPVEAYTHFALHTECGRVEGGGWKRA